MTVYNIGLNTGNTGSVLDAGITQGSPISAQGPFAGNYIEQSNSGTTQRVLYGFTGLPSAGAGAVTGAALTINNADTAGSTLSVELRELLSGFVEATATWNIRDTAINWNVAGALTGTDVASTVLATGTMPTASDTYFTLTGAGLDQLVLDWITGAKSVNGVIVSIVSDTSAGGGARRLRTSESADGVRPYLTFDFTAGSPVVEGSRRNRTTFRPGDKGTFSFGLGRFFKSRRPNTYNGVVGPTDTALVIQDATHGHAADNATLSTAGDTALVIQDSTHAHSTDGVNLTTGTVLVIQDATHAMSSDHTFLGGLMALANNILNFFRRRHRR